MIKSSKSDIERNTNKLNLRGGKVSMLELLPSGVVLASKLVVDWCFQVHRVEAYSVDVAYIQPVV